MALPKLNSSPKYELTIPSTGKRVKFRPYLVKEEKIMLMAFQSRDMKQSLQAVADTIEACLDEEANVRVEDLAVFDIEYLFTKIRAKSVGEVSHLKVKCKHCEAKNDYDLNLEEVSMKVKSKDNIIAITDSISVEMRYPSYGSISSKDIDRMQREQDTESVFEILSESMVAVHTSDERISMKDESKEDIENFIMSLTSTQFQKLTGFLNDMPQLSHKIDYMCLKCGEKNEVELKGMADFF
jgi:RNase P subunit RPR2